MKRVNATRPVGTTRAASTEPTGARGNRRAERASTFAPSDPLCAPHRTTTAGPPAAPGDQDRDGRPGGDTNRQPDQPPTDQLESLYARIDAALTDGASIAQAMDYVGCTEADVRAVKAIRDRRAKPPPAKPREVWEMW
ncbi:hypothetical protein JNW91_29010 [Micromonospora sp. STR1_7]|uniref:Uncharacterized protein n=1 Tax=Micromonospora parastrephiae TaxID=2806101 RepID=A0ABS1Y241_9ACTN|nr:hypothetical protein [Micromonospora parastrephiae]MBM0235464.1 hypothetical protein [Micromonospora parastrephiae]